MTTALILARGLSFAAMMLLFGSAAFRLALRRALPELAPRLPGRAAVLLIAVLAGIAWFVLATAQMSGDPAAITDRAVLTETATGTLFGQMVLLRLAVLLALALTWRWDWAALILSALALTLPAATSHAAGASPAHFTAIGITIDAIHLLACGFWIGGLGLLAGLGMAGIGKPRMLAALTLFSEWAMIAVLLLAMTGLINAATIILGGAGKAMPLYLGVLAAKLMLVAAMLALAVTNRFRLMPRFDDTKIARNVWIELSLGIVVIALAALLGQLPATAG